MFKVNLIMFDLDGTLVDSVPDLAACVDQLMDEMERPRHGEAKVRNWVGNGVPRLLERALAGELDGHPEKSEFDAVFPRFMDIYEAHNGVLSTLYPGVQTALKTLRSKNIKLACITNKSHRFTEPLLEKLGLLHYFDLVVSGDSLPKKKPDPLPLLHVAETLESEIESTLMVGDSMNDVKAARNAGCSVVAVPYGYNHGRDIRESKPDKVIKSLVEITDLIES